MAFDDQLFTKTMRVKRAERNWTQKDLARITGIQPSQISKYEKGQANPSIRIVCKIADAFECSLDEFNGPKATHENAEAV